MSFRGVYCPLATPFDHRGELYPSKIRHNLARLDRTTLAGYLIGDTAGEGHRLSSEEKRKLFAETAQVAAADKTLMAAVSSASNIESQRLAAAAADAGFAFAAARPVTGETEPVQTLYFRTLADQSPLPVVVLNGGPDRISAETLLQIGRHPNVAALADDGDDIAVLAAGPKPFLSGREDHICDDFEAGVRAFLLPLANAIPFYLLCLEEALRTREGLAARDLEARGRGAFSAVYAKLGAAGLKRAMDLRGAYGGSPRLPGLPLTPQQAAEVERLIDGLAS